MFGTQYQKIEKIRIVQIENLRLPIDPQKRSPIRGGPNYRGIRISLVLELAVDERRKRQKKFRLYLTPFSRY